MLQEHYQSSRFTSYLVVIIYHKVIGVTIVDRKCPVASKHTKNILDARHEISWKDSGGGSTEIL